MKNEILEAVEKINFEKLNTDKYSLFYSSNGFVDAVDLLICECGSIINIYCSESDESLWQEGFKHTLQELLEERLQNKVGRLMNNLMDLTEELGVIKNEK